MKLKKPVALLLSLLLMMNLFITAHAAGGEDAEATPTYTELYCSKTAKEAIDSDVLEQLCGLLINRVEPQAVNLLLDKLPALKAAAGQDGLSREIGMYVYYGKGDYDSYAHFIDGSAAASTSVCPLEDDDDNAVLGQLIAFNTKNIINKDTDEKTYFDTGSHEWMRFEYATIHELVHAMMNDYNRAGMLGYNDLESLNMSYGDARKIRNEYIRSLSFPTWFVEGTASIIGDGYDQVDDLYDLYRSTDGDFTAESVLNACLENNYYAIKANNMMAGYVSGYLAMFYLCDLAAKQNPAIGAAITDTNGEFSMDNQKLLYGFNEIISRLHGGETLDSIIKSLTDGRFENTADFEERFICGEQVDDTYSGDEETLGLCVRILNYFDGLTKTYGETASGSILVPFENVGAFPLDIDSDAQADIYQANGSNDFVVSVKPAVPYSDGGRSICGKDVPTCAQMYVLAEELAAAEWETIKDYDWVHASFDDIAEKLKGLTCPFSNTLKVLQAMESRADFPMALVEISDISFDFSAISFDFSAIVRESGYSFDPYGYEPLYGDIDGDGKVTICDATIIQRAKVSLMMLSTFQQELADVDSDSVVSVLDATFIQKYLASISADGNKTGESYYTW